MADTYSMLWKWFYSQWWQGVWWGQTPPLVKSSNCCPPPPPLCHGRHYLSQSNGAGGGGMSDFSFLASLYCSHKPNIASSPQNYFQDGGKADGSLQDSLQPLPEVPGVVGKKGSRTSTTLSPITISVNIFHTFHIKEKTCLQIFRMVQQLVSGTRNGETWVQISTQS